MNKLFLCLLSSALLAACATPESEGETEESKINPLDDPRVGEKVDRICFSSSISGFAEWEEGPGVILTRGVRTKYLAVMSRACAPLDFAQRIGVNSHYGSGCLSRGDRLFVSNQVFPSRDDSVFDSQFCRVTAIYEWDEDAKDAESEEAAPEDATEQE